MNPLDLVLKFIEDSREQGVPDRLIFTAVQVFMAENLLEQAEARGATRPTSQPTKPTVKRMGFIQ